MLTEKQKEERRTGLGGSDAAAVAGRSRYGTPLDVYLDKKGISEEKKETPQMSRGQKLEPLVRRLYELKTGHTVDVIKEMKRHETDTFMIANIDGIVRSEGFITEFKTVNYRMKEDWGAENTDNIPNDYVIQSAHYAHVYNVDRVKVVALFGTEDFFDLLMATDHINEESLLDICKLKVYEYRRNEELERKLVFVLKDFWENHILKDTPPDPETAIDVFRLYPESGNREIIARYEDVKRIQRIRQLREQKELLESEEKELKDALCRQMGDAMGMIDDMGAQLLTWQTQRSNRFNLDLFKETNPELYQLFCEKKSCRKFMIK
jgi:putative phage-type endonuclease